MPSLMIFNLSPKRALTELRKKYRVIKNAAVAPIVEQKDTRIVPKTKPNIAHPARVIITAPGSERAVTVM